MTGVGSGKDHSPNGEHRGRCLDCGDEWVEIDQIAICPECHSLNVVEVPS